MKTVAEPLSELLKEEPVRKTRICFVCSGNTCRSPMAAAVAEDLSKREIEALPECARALCTPPYSAFSAGLFAEEGAPASLFAVQALREAGISSDIENHRAHTLTEAEAGSYDLIVGMTGSHVMQLLLRFPSLSSRITGMPVDIPDPYGGSIDDYRRCLETIRRGVETLLSKKDGGAHE